MKRETKTRIALVTGAAGVLGFATSCGLLQDKIYVVMADIERERLDCLSHKLGPQLREAGVTTIAFDVSNPEEVGEAVERISRELGEIDILVNNAGILSNNKAESTTPQEWDRIMRTNLYGAFYLSQAVLPGMKRNRWGRIVNTGSLASKTGGITAGTAYSVSKGGITSLTFSLAAETAAYNITVNAIAPAYIRTPMVMEQLTDQQRAEVIQKIPVGRFCEPEEFAHVVRFLVHPMAGFITGEIIDQNGGLLFD